MPHAPRAAGAAQPLPPPSWRARLALHLERPWVHLLMLAAVAADVAITACELSLTDICPAPPAASADAARLHGWLARFALAGRALLAALLAHQALLMYSLGAARFLARRELVLDLVVVAVAVALEALEARAEHASAGNHNHHHQHRRSGADDAVLFAMLLWRVVRVAHGFFVTAEAEFEGEEHAALARELAEKVERLEGEIATLRSLVLEEAAKDKDKAA